MLHRYVLHNDEIRISTEALLAPGQVGLLAGWGVFSTLRVNEGVLFAWERHWARMSRDAALMRVPMPHDSEHVHERLLALVEANRAYEATMRVVIVRNRGGVWEGAAPERSCDLIALTANLKPWGASVDLCYEPQARHAACEFAGTKILSWAMNLTWLERAQAKGYDEVVLLNERGEVSECTSANIFMAKGAQVWTPPLSSGCLAGITREVLLSEIHVPGYEIGERPLLPADLENADEVFITSTTRELLAVARLGEKTVPNRGGARAALERAFSDYTDRYIAARRPAPVAR